MAEPLLSVRGLRYRYPGGDPVLNDVTFEIACHERVALLGPNGAGKSTLILHLNGLLLGEGEVRVGGVAVTRQTLKEIRRRVGVVFQDPDDQLFCPTLEADVAFGPRNFGVSEEEIERRIASALELVGLSAQRKRPPFQLSFGERKRAALATVLSCQPDVLVLDEPSANLDPRNRRRLVNWLRSGPGTVLIATHDLDLALEATDRCILLAGGRVVASGPSERILRDKKLLEAHALELPLRLQGWEGSPCG